MEIDEVAMMKKRGMAHDWSFLTSANVAPTPHQTPLHKT
jgi:hypothetical protein